MSGPIMLDIAGLELTEEDSELLAHPLCGGLILFSRNYESKEQLTQLISRVHKIRNPPIIVAVDQEGGRVQRFRDGFTLLPAMKQVGDFFLEQPQRGLQLCEDIGWLVAAELHDVGIDVNFAPVVDIDHGCSNVIGDRAFSNNPQQVARLARAFVNGLHSGGIRACIKHFPGHGAVKEDSHEQLPIDTRPQKKIWHDLEPFEHIIKTGVDAVMTAHLIVSCEGHELVSYSKHWVQNILRQKFGFKGIVFSDDLSMKGADTEGAIHEKVQRSLSAGCDFLPICNDRSAVVSLFDNASLMWKPCNFGLLQHSPKLKNSYLKTTRYNATIRSIEKLI